MYLLVENVGLKPGMVIYVLTQKMHNKKEVDPPMYVCMYVSIYACVLVHVCSQIQCGHLCPSAKDAQ